MMYASDHQTTLWSRIKRAVIVTGIVYIILRATRAPMNAVYWFFMGMPYVAIYALNRLYHSALASHAVGPAQVMVVDSNPTAVYQLLIALAVLLFVLGWLLWDTASGIRAVIWYWPLLLLPVVWINLSASVHYPGGSDAYMKKYRVMDCSQQEANLAAHGSIVGSNGEYVPCSYVLAPGAPIPR